SSSFFFSSRRRHTRFSRDWSSDVCSSDLVEQAVAAFERALLLTPERTPLLLSYAQAQILLADDNSLARAGRAVARVLSKEPQNRSEERRVGKGCRARGERSELAKQHARAN